jgi:hypothetical protein
MGTQWPQTASLPSQQGLLPLVAGLLDLGQVVQKGGVMNVMAIAGIVFT